MRTEARILLAIVLTIAVIVGTNVLFPPEPVETPAATGPSPDSVEAPAGDRAPSLSGMVGEPDTAEVAGETPPPQEIELPVAPPARTVTVAVDTLARYDFSTRGALVQRITLPSFESYTGEGAVQLVPEETRGILGGRIVLQDDTLDLRDLDFAVSPDEGFTLRPGDGPRSLTFSLAGENGVELRIVYTFRPETYVVEVETQIRGLGEAQMRRGVLLVDLGPGLALNEVEVEQELQGLAFVTNERGGGIESTDLRKVESAGARPGPFDWVAQRSKYFLLAVVAGGAGEELVAPTSETEAIGGVLVTPLPEAGRAAVTVSHPLGADGIARYRIFAGPQDYERLSNLDVDLEDANPYGWAFLRPILRPLVAAVIWVLTALHNGLGWGYGWVLIVFGILMRVVLFPLHQKAMRAQLKNMEFQPRIKELQERFKDQPQKLQQEMIKLYKEEGFNPLAGCLPMLLPWPVLITLFFVFQNTIELRGVEFLWLPDLSLPDPYYILPIFLAVSMFALQFISLRAMEEANPQMKMMMWFMPILMLVIFFQLASGLNLYYATANIASIPQQVWIANERKKARAARGRGKAKAPAGAG